MKIGKKIFYDIETGEVLVDTGERNGKYAVQISTGNAIQIYKLLSERNQDTFDYIELEYGQYAQDFAGCNGYRVNPETKELEFSYPESNEEGPQEPVYQEPLSIRVDKLEQAIDILIGGEDN